MYSNGDLELDSIEFLNFLKHNESALNITYSDTLETNLLLRYSPITTSTFIKSVNMQSLNCTFYPLDFQ